MKKCLCSLQSAFYLWAALAVFAIWLLGLQRGIVASTLLIDMDRSFSDLSALFAWICLLFAFGNATPAGFPTSGNGLWYREPGVNWSTQYLPIGNGYLGVMVSGAVDVDRMVLNIESLWSGGPFANSSYNGGNRLPSESTYLSGQMDYIRGTIFENPQGEIGNITVLTSDPFDYGSYSAAGWLLVSRNLTYEPVNYTRWLDLDIGVMRASWKEDEESFNREYFCSHPARACTQYTETSSTSGLSSVYSFLSIPGLPMPNSTCYDNATLLLRGLVSEPGMTYEILARVRTFPEALVYCSGSSNATISIMGAKRSWITWVGDTNYDMRAGDLAHNFSFLGDDPHAQLVELLDAASSQSYTTLLQEHLRDYISGTQSFTIDLGQTPDLQHSTDQLIANYTTDAGNPYLEHVLFNYGRYLLFSSARGNLPANLQGKWARDSSNPWGADYHSNINLQMNYWMAESTGLNLTQSLWDYIEQTWATRGAETATVLYNASRGWVTHDEMNIFGHTGMKSLDDENTAEWADYPESAAWMMVHLWDHFDYTNDVTWWQEQGWSLLKGVASFNLDRLIEDQHFNDTSLITAPCNSPEQVPITLACAHAQQLIWQMFNAVEKGFNQSGDPDEAFMQEVLAKRVVLDKGLHIGSWGQLQEWKVDMDQQNDTHRHLSHLVGLYPGYAISNYANQTSLSKADIMNAAEISLVHRGNGTGPDGDAGWEKVWRAAAWAQLGNAEVFYHELTYALERNFRSNLLSLYDPFDEDPIFQIDANLGFPTAILNALVQAPDVATYAQTLSVVLLPALPTNWPTGQLQGLNIRGGIVLDFSWNVGRLAVVTFTTKDGYPERDVQIIYKDNVITSFRTGRAAITTVHS